MFKVCGPIINRLLKAAGIFHVWACQWKLPSSPLIDTHHPVCLVTTHFSGDSQRAPFGSWKVWKGTLLPEPHVFVVGIDLTDRGNSQKVWVLLVIHHSHIYTQPQTPPLLRRHTLTGLTIQPSPCPLLSQYKSDFSRERTALLDYTHPSQKEYSLSTEQRKAPQSTAAWGAACHVSPSTTSDSPARVSYAETGKNNPTCPGVFFTVLVSVCLLYTEHMSCPWLPFVILDSAFQLEGILSISQGLSSGVKQRLWILWGQGQDHMVIRDSPRVVSERCPPGQRCQWSSYHLPLLCISVKMICQLSVNLVSLQNQDLTPFIIMITFGQL